LNDLCQAVAQPVLHVRVSEEAQENFKAHNFPAYFADLFVTSNSNLSGFYGFPVNKEGIVKVGNHGNGFTFNYSSLRHPREKKEGEQAIFAKVISPFSTVFN